MTLGIVKAVYSEVVYNATVLNSKFQYFTLIVFDLCKISLRVQRSAAKIDQHEFSNISIERLASKFVFEKLALQRTKIEFFSLICQSCEDFVHARFKTNNFHFSTGSCG